MMKQTWHQAVHANCNVYKVEVIQQQVKSIALITARQKTKQLRGNSHTVWHRNVFAQLNLLVESAVAAWHRQSRGSLGQEVKG